MKTFSNIIFWCEFPEEVNWKKTNKLIDFPAEIYIAAKTKKEFLMWKKKVAKKIKVGVWPILPRDKGYWFSAYSSKESIDTLNQFQGIPMKIDIEPPITEGECNVIKIFLAYVKLFLLNKPKNKRYIHRKINLLSQKNKVIISGFAWPKFILRLYGDDFSDNKKIFKNSFNYSTLTPLWLKPIYDIYYRRYIRKTWKIYGKRAYFAVGCIGHGVFGNENTYNSIAEFEADLRFLIKNNVHTIVIFDLAGLMKRKSPERWMKVIKKYLRNAF